MDRCTGLLDIIEIMLNTAVKTVQSLNSPEHSSFLFLYDFVTLKQDINHLLPNDRLLGWFKMKAFRWASAILSKVPIQSIGT